MCHICILVQHFPIKLGTDHVLGSMVTHAIDRSFDVFVKKIMNQWYIVWNAWFVICIISNEMLCVFFDWHFIVWCTGVQGFPKPSVHMLKILLVVLHCFIWMQQIHNELNCWINWLSNRCRIKVLIKDHWKLKLLKSEISLK